MSDEQYDYKNPPPWMEQFSSEYPADYTPDHDETGPPSMAQDPAGAWLIKWGSRAIFALFVVACIILVLGVVLKLGAWAFS